MRKGTLHADRLGLTSNRRSTKKMSHWIVFTLPQSTQPKYRVYSHVVFTQPDSMEAHGHFEKRGIFLARKTAGLCDIRNQAAKCCEVPERNSSDLCPPALKGAGRDAVRIVLLSGRLPMFLEVMKYSRRNASCHRILPLPAFTSDVVIEWRPPAYYTSYALW
jgi:hypothetical protein